jgi:hypothetical protein
VAVELVVELLGIEWVVFEGSELDDSEGPRNFCNSETGVGSLFPRRNFIDRVVYFYMSFKASARQAYDSSDSGI